MQHNKGLEVHQLTEDCASEHGQSADPQQDLHPCHTNQPMPGPKGSSVPKVPRIEHSFTRDIGRLEDFVALQGVYIVILINIQ